MIKKSFFTAVFVFLLTHHAFTQPFKLTDNTFKKGQFLPLWDIYFEMGRGALQIVPQLQLDSLADFLIRHKNLKIEIGVHTDFRGDDQLNLKLSKERAVALKNY